MYMRVLSRLFLAVLLLALSHGLYAQPDTTNIYSPDGIFDTVLDNYGKAYRLSEIEVPASPGSGGRAAQIICSSGYFDLYFETGSGMEDQNIALHNQRRDVICQVFADLSNFIIPANANNRVRIRIDNISNATGGNPAGVLGVASPYFTLPAGAPSIRGIADNQIWITINSGRDGYTNVANPIAISSSSQTNSGLFYHGYLAINFAAFSWNLNLAQAAPANTYDLYTVALHEITHALGLASAITATGSPVFGNNFPYYTRYDRQLQNAAGVNLITNSGSCQLYSYTFNPALNAATTLSPNAGACSTDNTTCATAVKFNYTSGTLQDQAVYTTNCFEQGSSLSHLEEQCHLPNALTNNQYYVMSNANGTGSAYTKRFYKQEERNVLCELGYNTALSFGNSLSPLNNTTYTAGACPARGVAGINDGLNANGTFTWLVTAGTQVAIPIAALLANDAGANSIECVERVYNTGNTPTISGSNVLFTPGQQGLSLLRYIPVNTTTGVKGNITYIYVRANSAGCTPSACGNMVSNGDFEMGPAADPYGCVGSFDNEVPCWSFYVATPDYFGSACPYGSNDVPTVRSAPPSDSWNGIANNNHHFLGLLKSDGNYEEAAQVQLNTPIVAGTYQLSFWAKVSNISLPVSSPAFLHIAASQNTLVPLANGFDPASANLSLMTPNGIIVPNNNIWNKITFIYTYTGADLLNNLIIAQEVTSAPPGLQDISYVYIDQLELYPINSVPVFNPQSPLCLGQTILLDATPPGGVFAGPGVVNNENGTYSFNAGTAGAGSHNIAYTYTTSTGCTVVTGAQITVNNAAAPAAAISPLNPAICSGSIMLTAAAATSYTWNTGAITQSITVSPITSTQYSVTVANATGCTAVGTSTVTVAGLAASQATTCTGMAVTLTAEGGTTYAWSNGAGNVATQAVSPTGTTTYTVTITNAQCSTVKSVTVTVDPNCCAAANAGLNAAQNAQLTFGHVTSAQLLAQVAAVNPAWVSGNTLLLGSNQIVINGTLSLNGNLAFVGCSNVLFGVNGQIQTNNYKLESYISNFMACGTQMWQGIVVNHASGEVFFSEYWFARNRIVAAQAGVTGNVGGKISMLYTDFENCLRGISIANVKPAVFNVYGCRFGTPVTPLKTYTNSPAGLTMMYRGVEIMDINNTAANALTIGFASLNNGAAGDRQNRFAMSNNDNSDILNPVYIRNAYVNVLNSYMLITENKHRAVAGANTGIMVEYNGAGSPATVNVGNRTEEGRNLLYNGNWGIYAQGRANLNVNTNTFTAQRTTAIVSGNNNAATMLIRANTIQSNKNYSGIFITGAYATPVTIDSNLIGTTTATAAVVNTENNLGININSYAQALNNTTTGLLIADNRLYDLNRGILLNTVQFSEVRNNAIYLNGFQNPPANFTWYGIEAVNSTYPNIYQNTILPEPTATIPAYTANNSLTGKIIGIHINTLQAFNSQDYAAWIACNQVQRMHWGVGVTGGNPGGFFLRQNQMNANKAAFTIYNNGNIGQQGTSIWANDNRWIGLNPANGEFHFGYYNTSISTMPPSWFVRNAVAGGDAELNPNLFSGGVRNERYPLTPSPLIFPVASITASNTNTGCAPFRNQRSGKRFEYEELVARLEAQITDTFNYSELPTHYHLWKEEQVLDVLMSNTELLEESDELWDFYYHPQRSSYIALMGLFRKAEGTKDVAELKNLAVQAQAITPATTHEANMQALMLLMAKAAELPQLWQDMAGTDSVLLYSLAAKCFVTDGQSVLYARSFWNSKVGFDDRQFTDYCLATTGSYKKDITNEQALIPVELQVYPTRLRYGQVLNIISPISGAMEVYAIDGKKAGTYTIEEGGQTLNEFDLITSQMLLLRFRLSNGNIIFKKIMLYK
jgi:hypothetical protein